MTSRLFKRFGGVQSAVVRLTEPDARSLLGLGKLRVGWVNCHIRERKEAQDLLMQSARKRGADVMLISEQHKWSENFVWYQDASRRAEILVCSPDLSIGDFLETDAGFVWVEVSGVRVYSCYFTPNDPFGIFETQILLLEESLGEASERSLIAGDFNSKSPEWGEARLDRRGILVGEMVATNDLIV